MRIILTSAAALALTAASPSGAQILGGGGGIGGGLGGTLGGGLGGGLRGDIGGTLRNGSRITGETTNRVRGSTRADRRRVRGDAAIDSATRLGERRIVTRETASAELSRNDLIRTRGAVAATRRGLRRVAPTASGVQVFVPQVAVAAPLVVPTTVHAYPAYSPAYYYGPDAVFVGSSHVDVYMDRQYQDLEASLRDTGADVRKRGRDIVVSFPADVTFAFDKADIRSRFYGPLNAFARTLNEYPGTDVEILGHTDSVGSETYNLGLSERRGRSVADFLADRSVSPARMVVQAVGEGEPVATNATVEGRAANRRVEMILHPRAG